MQGCGEKFTIIRRWRRAAQAGIVGPMRLLTTAAALVWLLGCSRAHEAAGTSPSSPSTHPEPSLVGAHTSRLEPQALVVTHADDRSPFGIAASHWSSKTLPKWLPKVRDTGVTWLRGFDLSAIDERLAEAEREQVHVAGFLTWSAPGKPLSFPVDDLPAWSDYVEKMVARCKGRVKYWEVWNEPPNFTEDKSPESYAKVVVAAYRAAKRADPTVQVGIATKSNHVQWLEAAIVAGAKNHFDYVTVHPYEVLGMVAKGGEPLFLNIVPTLRAMLQASNPERENAPIWFTELGQPVDKTWNAEQQAVTLVKAYTLGIAQGATRIHWFEGQDGDSGPFGILDGQGNTRPSYHALTALIDAVGAEPNYLGWLILEQGSYGFVFSRDGSYVMVAWAPPGLEVQVRLDREVTVLDPITGRRTKAPDVALTSAPVLVSGLSEGYGVEARSNAARPFPWDGDYSGMQSVSLVAPDVQSGVHQLATPVVKWFGNTPARDASGSARHAFVVDPNFLSYDTVPLRITVVVRRNGIARAGFNLKYESTSGWKTAEGGWYTIPDSPAFTTKEFIIKDSRFVGNWAYHFMLDSDSEKFSQYSIQSITVTKL